MKNKEKLISLFKYIQELYAQKHKVVTDVKQHEWYCFLDSIPNDENIEVNYVDRVESDEDLQNGDNYILRVTKPEFQACPKPPESISKWLENGWEKFSNQAKKIEVKYKEINKKEEEKITFEDNIQRVEDFEKWIEQRDEWVIRQEEIDRVRKFFNQLYMNFITLNRDSETIELMVGQGIISESESSNIYHPVLLKRLSMEFDSKNNVISIIDTAVESEIYTMLLQEMDYINHTAIKTLKEQLSEHFYHPLDRNETPDFLKIFIHMLHPESKFIEDTSEKKLSLDKLFISSRPVFFIRKKMSGVVNAIEEIVGQIEVDGVTSGPLLNLVGDNKLEVEEDIEPEDLSDKLASLSGQDKEILLSKEANSEQLEIAKRIERYSAVLVQGPPGTGKTHTIANLMGHFLAQGKNILVTSHTKKALSVVKEKVPAALQNLCVSVLEDTNKDMERSIDGITEYMSAHSSHELHDTAEKLKVIRDELLDEISEIRKKIFSIKYKEYQPIVVDGKGYSPSEAAKYVYENSEILSIIPGKVTLYKPLPINLGELAFLYETNGHVDKNEERELGYELPNPNILITPSAFEKKVIKYNNNLHKLKDIQYKLGEKINIDLEGKHIKINQNPLIANTNEKLLKELEVFIDSNSIAEDWLLYATVDGKKGGGYKVVWENLIETINDTNEFANKIVEKTIGKECIIDSSLNRDIAKLVLNELTNHFKQGKKITKLNLLLKKQWKEILEKVQINGREISNEEDSEIALSYITLTEKRSKLSVLWSELIGKNGGPVFEDFGEEPERMCLRRVDKITEYLNWYDKTYINIRNKMDEAGINSHIVFDNKEFNSDMEELEYILSVIIEDLPLYIEAIRIIYIEMAEIDNVISKTKEILDDESLLESSICRDVLVALDEKNTNDYRKHHSTLDKFYRKYHFLNERVRILEMLKVNAPDWADQIKNRIGIHGQSTMPENIENAWKCKQFAGIIDYITSEPFEHLQKKSVELSKELKKITAELAESLAWFHLLKDTEKDIEKKQALQGWKLTVKKIGKGTGKKAPRLKREAQKLMAKCQRAVPAWIMPVNKALESLDPTSNKFDIVIIDEASQSDISALAIMYLAKKVIIVGDDEQVSPMAVGIDTEKMYALSSMYIKDIIPNSHLYDMNSSLYDIAKTTFPTLMLKEHFRCVPEIIGYSNKLSYDYKIKPLRDESSSFLKPATISFRVDGERNGSQKVNDCEANHIVALMLACIEEPKYDNMTFGVISLLGDEQAKKINNIAINKIPLEEYEKRKILCGNASHFQGDERDIVFISLVDSNESEGPLRMVGEGSGKSIKQRYNVAASRAKNQLWVVHSLDVTRDLKNGDMRKDLIEYVRNPQALFRKIDKVNASAESHFEKLVGRDLVSKGYHIVPQWVVGSYRIDMVAVYGNQKVAIECDGELYHSGEEKIREDMERQAILERLGWRFIRIRGSEYYRNPKQTIDRVIKELTFYDIHPESISNDEASIDSNELFERVKIRASQILDEWNNQDNEEDYIDNLKVI